ncbi:unnamed protein product [Schistocephalus solidus]|uniref:Metastasis-associated protein MTA2 n=1 Tax=Schistocephalus solidus TaxID=70667 RepID=A0A183SP94_SCHSO|nr:unnamed protein product [Schistocephalus solidus]
MKYGIPLEVYRLDVDVGTLTTGVYCFQTPTGAVEAKVTRYYRRRDISSNLIQQAEKYYFQETDSDSQNSPDSNGGGGSNANSLTDIQRHQIKHRELFLSREVECLPATHIRGKCSVTLYNEVEPLTSYVQREDAFYYRLIYDPSTKRLQEDRGSMRIGSDYQSEIQPLLKKGCASNYDISCPKASDTVWLFSSHCEADDSRFWSRLNGDNWLELVRALQAIVNVTARVDLHNCLIVMMLLGEKDPRFKEKLEELVWDPALSLSPAETDLFISLTKAVGLYARSCDPTNCQPFLLNATATASRDITLQYAHDILFKANYDLKKAMLFLLPAGLDYVTDCAPPCMTIRGSSPGQFNPSSSPTMDAEYRRPFHYLPHLDAPGSLYPRPMGNPSSRIGTQHYNSEWCKKAPKVTLFLILTTPFPQTIFNTGFTFRRPVSSLTCLIFLSLTSTSSLKDGRPSLCRDELETWTAGEAALFEEALEKYSKFFPDILTDFLPWKTPKSIVELYYFWKTTERYTRHRRNKMTLHEHKLKQVYIPNYSKPNSAVLYNRNDSTDRGCACCHGESTVCSRVLRSAHIIVACGFLPDVWLYNVSLMHLSRQLQLTKGSVQLGSLSSRRSTFDCGTETVDRDANDDGDVCCSSHQALYLPLLVFAHDVNVAAVAAALLPRQTRARVRSVERAGVESSPQWYAWGPPHLMCRLCSGCWTYWKKYGGLKNPDKRGNFQLHALLYSPGCNQPHLPPPSTNALIIFPRFEGVTVNSRPSPEQRFQDRLDAARGAGTKPVPSTPSAAAATAASAAVGGTPVVDHRSAPSHHPLPDVSLTSVVYRCTQPGCFKEFRSRDNLITHLSQVHSVLATTISGSVHAAADGNGLAVAVDGASLPAAAVPPTIVPHTHSGTECQITPPLLRLLRILCPEVVRPARLARRPTRPASSTAIAAAAAAAAVSDAKALRDCGETVEQMKIAATPKLSKLQDPVSALRRKIAMPPLSVTLKKVLALKSITLPASGDASVQPPASLKRSADCALGSVNGECQALNGKSGDNKDDDEEEEDEADALNVLEAPLPPPEKKRLVELATTNCCSNEAANATTNGNRVHAAATASTTTIDAAVVDKLNSK